MKKIKTEYMVIVTSYSKKSGKIRRILKKSDDSIKNIKKISVQETRHQNVVKNIDYKYLHHFLVKTKPSASLKLVYSAIIKDENILDINIKLI